MKCDSHASLLVHTLASLCLGHEPKAKVATVGIGGKLAVKVKIQGATTTCYVDILYGTKLNIIFSKKTKLSRKSLWEKYGICNKGITPKKLKTRKEIKEEKVVVLFGPYSCNEYKYCHIENKALISRVETLWTIMHQKTQVPNIRMINKAETCGIAYKIKTWKKVN
jgi:hypothetical protein